MRVNIKIENFDQFRRELRQAGKKLGDAMEPAIKEGMELIADKARQNVPAVTGHIRDAIKSKVDGKGQNYVVAHIGTIGADKDTAIAANALEYGHAAPGDAGGVKVAAAVPFMRNALKTTKNRVKKVVQNHVENALK